VVQKKIKIKKVKTKKFFLSDVLRRCVHHFVNYLGYSLGFLTFFKKILNFMENFQKNIPPPKGKYYLKKFQTLKKHFRLKSAVKNLTAECSLKLF